VGRLRGTMPALAADAIANLAPWAEEFDRLSAGTRFSAAEFMEWCRLEALGPDPQGERFAEHCRVGQLRQELPREEAALGSAR
jgi:hypothetical protein